MRQTLRHTDNQCLQITHRTNRMRKWLHRAVTILRDILPQLMTCIIQPHVQNQTTPPRSLHQRFRELHMVRRLLEQNGFVEHRVSDGVQPLGHKTRVAEITQHRQSLEDLNEQLVGKMV